MTIRRVNNDVELDDKIREQRLLEAYSGIKPYLIRLFTHALILFISIRAYNNYKDSATNYEEFLELLDNKVITNVTTISRNVECSTLGDNWQAVDSITFPEVLAGCRCENDLYEEESCSYISSVNGRPSDQFNENCNYLNKLIRNEVVPDDEIPDAYKKGAEKPSPNDYNFTTQSKATNSTTNSSNTTNKVNNRNLKLSKPDIYQKQKQDMSLFDERKRVLRLLADESNSTFALTAENTFDLPTDCRCYQEIEAMQGKTISHFLPKSQICYEVSKTMTSLTYLASAAQECEPEFTCQRHFCRNANESCPVVDVWFDNLFQNTTSQGEIVSYYDSVRYAILSIIYLIYIQRIV